MGYDVIIIGGGASGLMAAVAAGRRGRFALILDQKERSGKKILATGNGKCNYTNHFQTPDCYRGGGKDLAFRLLKKFGWKETVDFFSELGILPKERDGYYYPNSEQAISIAEVLRMEVLRTGGSIRCLERVRSLKKEKGEFLVETVHVLTKEEKGYQKIISKGIQQEGECRIYRAPKVILAAGGMASPAQGSDGSGLKFAKELGHTIVSPIPALTQMRAKEKFLNSLAGVRFFAKGTLFVGQPTLQKPITFEEGEFLFTSYGISGIPILQMSRFAGNALFNGLSVYLELDFLPKIEEEQLVRLLQKRFGGRKENSSKTAEEALVGLLHNKINFVLLKRCEIEEKCSVSDIKETQLLRLAKQIKHFHLIITDTNGFEQAQVMAGGIDICEVKEETLESKIVEGLYFAGEILDVDGICGGYNLQWAWTSGQTAGNAV